MTRRVQVAGCRPISVDAREHLEAAYAILTTLSFGIENSATVGGVSDAVMRKAIDGAATLCALAFEQIGEDLP